MISLLDVRAKCRAALAPVADSDPAVLDITDSVEPPCIVVSTGEPWLEMFGQSPTLYARLALLVVGDRIDPGPGVEQVEVAMTYALARLAADAWPWVPLNATAPRATAIAGVNYLASELAVRIPVAVA